MRNIELTPEQQKLLRDIRNAVRGDYWEPVGELARSFCTPSDHQSAVLDVMRQRPNDKFSVADIIEKCNWDEQDRQSFQRARTILCRLAIRGIISRAGRGFYVFGD